jgi:hypothetical protein
MLPFLVDNMVCAGLYLAQSLQLCILEGLVCLVSRCKAERRTKLMRQWLAQDALQNFDINVSQGVSSSAIDKTDPYIVSKSILLLAVNQL